MMRWSRLLPQRLADCFAISILARSSSGPITNAVRSPGARILENDERYTTSASPAIERSVGSGSASK